MKFADALEALKQGKKVKLPSWSGYWVKENDTVKMYCKDGKILDIRETEDVFYTLSNIASEDWILADENAINLNVHTFTFGEAIRLMKQGKKVARKGWNGKGMFLFLVCPTEIKTDADVGFYSVHQSIAMSTADSSIVIGWLASQVDMLAEDWVIVE